MFTIWKSETTTTILLLVVLLYTIVLTQHVMHLMKICGLSVSRPSRKNKETNLRECFKGA